MNDADNNQFDYHRNNSALTKSLREDIAFDTIPDEIHEVFEENRIRMPTFNKIILILKGTSFNKYVFVKEEGNEVVYRDLGERVNEKKSEIEYDILSQGSLTKGFNLKAKDVVTEVKK